MSLVWYVLQVTFAYLGKRFNPQWFWFTRVSKKDFQTNFFGEIHSIAGPIIANGCLLDNQSSSSLFCTKLARNWHNHFLYVFGFVYSMDKRCKKKCIMRTKANEENT